MASSLSEPKGTNMGDRKFEFLLLFSRLKSGKFQKRILVFPVLMRMFVKRKKGHAALGYEF